MANSHLEPVLLSAYLDDEVSMDERNQVERHLVTCETCQVELDGLRWTSNLLHQLPEVPLPRTFYLTEAMLEEPVSPIKKGWLEWIQSLFNGLGAVPIGVGATVMALVLLMVIVQPFSTISEPQIAMAPIPTSEILSEEIAPLAMQSEQESALMNDEGNAAAMGVPESHDDSFSTGIAAVSEEIEESEIKESKIEDSEIEDSQSDMAFETMLSSDEEANDAVGQESDASIAARATSAEDIQQDASASAPAPTLVSTPRVNRAISATATADITENTVVAPSSSPIALVPKDTSLEEGISPSDNESVSSKSSQFRLVTLILIGIVLFFISCMIYWRRRAS